MTVYASLVQDKTARARLSANGSDTSPTSPLAMSSPFHPDPPRQSAAEPSAAQDFFKAIERHLRYDAKETVVAIIDEQPGMFDHACTTRRVEKAPEAAQEQFRQRWNTVTNYQLRILSLAAQTPCRFCEISFGGPSTEQIRAMLESVDDNRRADEELRWRQLSKYGRLQNFFFDPLGKPA